MKDILKRELGLWKLRPVYVLAPLGAMLFCSLFFLTFFGKGAVQELPIAVVDNDNSSLTRNFIRQLDDGQGDCNLRASGEYVLRRSCRQETYGVVLLEHDVLCGRNDEL